MEIALVPAVTWDRHTILAFYAGNRTIPFSLHQSNRDLLIESQREGAKTQGSVSKLYVHGVFRGDRDVFIAVTSDGRETMVYVNGVLATVSRRFTFASKDLAGELILGNSPLIDDSWYGLMKELVVYHGFLSQRAALVEYQSWAKSGHPPLPEGERPEAVYSFDQVAGRVIRNQSGQGPALYIPGRFTVLDHLFLERPWSEYKRDGNYGKDVFINICGFVPLGFILCAYLSLALRSRHAKVLTILIGAAVSVTVEVLQAYLPTRFSGMTDILTNTFGTAVGVVIYVCAWRVCEGLRRSRSHAVRQIAGWLIARA